jgi:hypothetical protein
MAAWITLATSTAERCASELMLKVKTKDAGGRVTTRPIARRQTARHQRRAIEQTWNAPSGAKLSLLEDMP